MSSDFHFRAPIWLYEGSGAWHFITLPREVADEIHAAGQTRGRPWGTVRVTARIGTTRWQTSLFRDRKRESYLLPIKAAVRTREQLRAGEDVEVLLRIDCPEPPL